MIRKTDQLPISEVITGLPRPYNNTTQLGREYKGFRVLEYQNALDAPGRAVAYIRNINLAHPLWAPWLWVGTCQNMRTVCI